MDGSDSLECCYHTACAALSRGQALLLGILLQVVSTSRVVDRAAYVIAPIWVLQPLQCTFGRKWKVCLQTAFAFLFLMLFLL